VPAVVPLGSAVLVRGAEVAQAESVDFVEGVPKRSIIALGGPHMLPTVTAASPMMTSD